MPPWAQSLVDSNRSVMESLNRVAQSLGQPRPAPTPEPEEAELSAADLEALPRAQFAEYIANRTIKHMEKTVVKPLKEQLQQVTLNTSNVEIRTAVEAAKAKYPDFMDYKDDMIALARTHTSLPPEDLYLLARTKSGKAPVAAKPSKGADDTPPKVPKIRFGGLKPANGGEGGDRNRKMSVEDALHAAWNEVAGSLGEPNFEE
jgi:hypothetical protein